MPKKNGSHFHSFLLYPNSVIGYCCILLNLILVAFLVYAMRMSKFKGSLSERMEENKKVIEESIFHMPVKKVRIDLLKNPNEIKVDENGKFFPK